MELKTASAIRGGEFLVKESTVENIFIPEDFNEEMQMMAQSCLDFLEAEVVPVERDLEKMQDPSIMPNLLTKAGEMGLLGISVPDIYGGLGLDFKASMLVAESLGGGESFAVAYGAHTGIATLPILFYGTDAQKAKYIPGLASGELKGCYCLTEPDSGSDANAAKSKAKLSADGKSYIINGQKMWITNGGFAQVMIVFAKIDDDEVLTAFIVDSNTPGVTMNEEEKKLGIKGSSTRQIFFNDVTIPVENLLGERQGGFKIALNVLNIGRIKLGAAVTGGSKRAFEIAIKFALERKQFKKSIAEFPAIQHKIAEMAIKIFASESMMYRASNDIDQYLDVLIDKGMDLNTAKYKSVEEYAAECAMIKVYASEALDYVADETVQIFGGMGFSADALAEKIYRDARINRIFEGTNEINRMLTVDILLKKAMKGSIDLMGPAMAVSKELISIPDFGGEQEEGYLVAEGKQIKNLKKVFLMVAGSAVQKYMMELKNEQELLMLAADIATEVYACESMWLRLIKLNANSSTANLEVKEAMFKAYLHDSVEKVNATAKTGINYMTEGDEMRMLMLGLKRFTKSYNYNSIAARRAVAQHFIDLGHYAY